MLPVLEDANSIQMSLMQVMRLMLTAQIEHKTASLLLYALQTASANLRLTRFDPHVHEVILDPRQASASPLDRRHIWSDEDFEEEEEEEVDEVEQEIEKKVEEAAEKARYVARWEAKKEIEARERARKRYEEEEKLKDWVEQHPRYMLVRRDGHLVAEQRPQQVPEKKRAAATRTDEIRAQITDMVHKDLPALTKVYNEETKKEAAKVTTEKEQEKKSK
jgi:hypothetical protein